jgi:hypothetical protein
LTTLSRRTFAPGLFTAAFLNQPASRPQNLYPLVNMSVLASQDQAELAQLLQALQSADNNVRAQAEEHLANNWTNTKPEMLLMGLVEQIRGSTDTTVSFYKISLL